MPLLRRLTQVRMEAAKTMSRAQNLRDEAEMQRLRIQAAMFEHHESLDDAFLARAILRATTIELIQLTAHLVSKTHAPHSHAEPTQH